MLGMKWFAALLWFSIVVCAAEPDWPQFRGPDLNPVGLSKALPDRWSKTENVEWVATIPGRGWSSPIVTGGKVFVTTAVTEGKSKPPQIGTTYSNDYHAELMKKGVEVELCGATATVHNWGNEDLLAGIKVNTNAMARMSELAQKGFVQITEWD